MASFESASLVEGGEKSKSNASLSSSMSCKMLNALSSYKSMVVGSNSSFLSLSLSKRFASLRQSITGERNEEGTTWEHTSAQAEFRKKLHKDLDAVDDLV
jgi:hypothetical protein